MILKETIEFGRYPQSDKNGCYKEPIEWYILDCKGKLMLISKLALDCRQYHNEEVEDITWETSFIRYWLNHVFFSEAFNIEEKSFIHNNYISADKNIWYRTDPGKDTRDAVFLLSINEVEKYLPSDIDRQCMPTEYAVNQGAWKGFEGNCWWWLRTPGFADNFAAFIRSGGGIRDLGADVFYKKGAIRPAIYVDENLLCQK